MRRDLFVLPLLASLLTACTVEIEPREGPARQDPPRAADPEPAVESDPPEAPPAKQRPKRPKPKPRPRPRPEPQPQPQPSSSAWSPNVGEGWVCVADLKPNARGIASARVDSSLGRFQEICLWAGGRAIRVQRLTLQLEGRDFWRAPLGGKILAKSPSSELQVPKAPRRVDRVILRCEPGAAGRALLFGRRKRLPQAPRWTTTWEGWDGLGEASVRAEDSVCEVPVTASTPREVIRVEASGRLECSGAQVVFADNTRKSYTDSFVLERG